LKTQDNRSMARVLLVDDDLDSLEAARDILASAGHTVVTADTLAGARAQLATDLPDVLLLDLMLPDGNGLELLDEVVNKGLRRIVGAFERAKGGTLFLDKLAEMPIGLQPHFLRVLETAKVQPVGSEQEVAVDARIVAATNRDPEQAIASKLLRQDLYFRLNVLPIAMPPLR